MRLTVAVDGAKLHATLKKECCLSELCMELGVNYSYFKNVKKYNRCRIDVFLDACSKAGLNYRDFVDADGVKEQISKLVKDIMRLDWFLMG